MKIVFRVDSSILLGSGHVTRCLVLAEELKKRGGEVAFISRSSPGDLNDFICEKGFLVFPLKNSEYSGAESDFNKLIYDSRSWPKELQEIDASDSIKILEKIKPVWIIVDHYSLDVNWENIVRPYSRNLMAIDDLANRAHVCDLLLDQNWFENMEDRYKGLINVDCTQLLGPKYALLRPEFAKEKKKLRSKSEISQPYRLFVFFGGSDSHNLTSITVNALSHEKLKHLEVDIVIGSNNPHKEDLADLVAGRPSIKLHIQTDDMAEIMSRADFAIGSGGVNTLERLCLGLPSSVITCAQNQEIAITDLTKNNFVNFIGTHLTIKMSTIESAIIEMINSIRDNNNYLSSGKLFVDGLGAQYVCNWLIGDFSEYDWNIVQAHGDHMELYWVWSNEKEVRNNAINKHSISWQAHTKWYNKKLNDEKCYIFIACCDKIPIGQVRFEIEDKHAKISYSIAKQFRGRKMGRRLMEECIIEFRKQSDISLLAEVISDNKASEKVFRALGFSLEEKSENKLLFLK